MRTVYDGLDEPEDIQKCLNCTKKECTNCLAPRGDTRSYQRAYLTQERKQKRAKSNKRNYEENKEYIKEHAKVLALKRYLRRKGL